MDSVLASQHRVSILILLALISPAFCTDWDFTFCGTWHHIGGLLTVGSRLSPGCSGLSVYANESHLSIDGEISARCQPSGQRVLERDRLNTTPFCLLWEPLQDLLMLQFGDQKWTLCWPSTLPDSCCTSLSHGPNAPQGTYGIADGAIKDDVITHKTLTGFQFRGSAVSCRTLCQTVNPGVTAANRPPGPQAAVASCAGSSQLEMKEDFRGLNINAPVMKGSPPESPTSVYLPPSLRLASKNNSRVMWAFFRNTSPFQEDHKEHRILGDVVEISVEDKVIANLSEPIRITFSHDLIPKTHRRECVSWDTRKDPMKVSWSSTGCETQTQGHKHTECLCSHLTYFAVLVQIDPQPVRHLLPLTVITSVGCSLSVISCGILIVFLCRSRRSKEQTTHIHLGLAMSLLFLNLLFFFTSVVGNIGGCDVCMLMGAGVHYALLSSFNWMGIEVFHTFWRVYMVFTPPPKPMVWNLLGFFVPCLPVSILLLVGDIYGQRMVVPSRDESNPYLMCWMKQTPPALLAHYFTNITALALLVSAGTVMLILIYCKIRNRDEWRQRRVAVVSMWGLSCLFGTTWGLTFLNFGPLSDVILFLSCILNSLQGFVLMLRFYILDRMQKREVGSSLGSSSTGSTRQHMLQAQEKR